MQKSEVKLEKLVHNLINRGFLEWHYWITQSTEFVEERRSKKESHLLLLHYLDAENSTVPTEEAVKKIKVTVRRRKSYSLIAQLCSTYGLGSKFDATVKINLEKRRLDLNGRPEGQGGQDD